MKKKILEALTTKFEGVDAKILDRIAAKLAKTVTKEEEVEPAVEGVTFQEVLTSYGDARATEASNTAVSNYEKKHGLKDGKKVTTDGDDDQPDDDADDDDADDDSRGGKSKANPKAKKSQKDDEGEAPAWVKKLLDANKELKDRLDAIDKGKVAASRREKLNKAIDKLTDKQKKPYSRIKLDDMSDDDFETFLEEVTEEAEDMAADNVANDATFGAPLEHKGGDSKKATDKEIESIADALNI